MRPLLSIWTKPIETFEYLAERRLAGKENHLGFLIVLNIFILGTLFEAIRFLIKH